MLAIEFDGSSHENRITEDEKRQYQLEAKGMKFLRFSDDEVIQNTDGVVEDIREWILSKRKETHPSR